MEIKGMRMILRENALEAWAMAVYYCDEILKGKGTLSNKKLFVKSLQNSVELFVKQHMLNVNDFRVAEVRQWGSDGEPLKRYILSNNLNDFFLKNSKKQEMKRFFTIEFNKIKDIQKELFSEFYKARGVYITNELAILQKLRNDETHFYISNDDFMTEIEFRDLHNMMIVFYGILKYYKLLPFIGKPFGKYEQIDFERKPLKRFSFKSQLKKSHFVRKLKENIEGKAFPYFENEAYGIAKNIVRVCDVYSELDFKNIWTYIQMLIKYEMFETHDEIGEVDMINGEVIEGILYREYKIKI